MSINWGQVYNSPIGQILGDLNPQTFMQLTSAGTSNQLSQLQSQLQQNNTLMNAWTTLQSDAQSVNGSLSTLNTASTFQQLQATSSSPTVATAADSSAQAGSYQISIDQLAQTQIDQASPTTAITSPTAALNLSGSFQVYVGTAPSASITITASDTLQQVASAINHANTGVTATAVQLSSGNWGLDLQGNATGASNRIHYVVGSSSGSVNPLQALGFSTTSTSGTSFVSGATDFAGAVVQAAQNAYLNFGAPMTPPAPGSATPSGMISSSSNTFSNAIPGLTLTADSPGSTTITVSPNVTGMTSSIQSFVNNWNQWVSDTAGLAEGGSVQSTGSGSSQSFTFSTNNKQVITSGIPQNTVNQVAQILGGTVGSSSSTYQSLADIGITLGNTGALSINSTTLDNALTNNPSGVAQLFQNLYKALNPSQATGVLPSFFQSGSQGVTSEMIAYETQQKQQIQSQITLLNNQVSAENQQATIQYGQWVSQVAKAAQQYSLLTAIFNPNPNTPGG